MSVSYTIIRRDSTTNTVWNFESPGEQDPAGVVVDFLERWLRVPFRPEPDKESENVSKT